MTEDEWTGSSSDDTRDHCRLERFESRRSATRRGRDARLLIGQIYE
jgi:hypothetical protein